MPKKKPQTLKKGKKIKKQKRKIEVKKTPEGVTVKVGRKR